MNRTNGGSKDNAQVCAGEMRQTDKGIEVPEYSSKKGPSVISVKFSNPEEIMMITVQDSQLKENGELECEGKSYKIFSPEAFKKVKENRKVRQTEKVISATELETRRQTRNVSKASGEGRE